MKDASLAQQMADDAASDDASQAKAFIARVGELAVALRAAQAEVDCAELALKERKAAVQQIESVDMPELLREGGLTSVKLSDGTKVDLKDDFSCSITEARREDCLDWLAKNNHASIIKTALAVSFGKGEDEEAVEALQELTVRYGERVSMEEKVHNATLKSLLKELLAAGSLSTDAQSLFGVVPYSFAKLTAPKKK